MLPSLEIQRASAKILFYYNCDDVSMEEGRISKGEQPIIKGYESPGVDESLKYQLLGPSLIKAGQDSVDQRKVRGKRLLVFSQLD